MEMLLIFPILIFAILSITRPLGNPWWKLWR